ncbi:MltA-interacting MipA [Cupriavidus basilensis OR16]|uniref:MltA-interacting MipA n=1 Tax=Cupriavidus basilensis OR16 TaxID=1127483 RepID=H1SA35_9BURK|nr:MipA/OmpV family protein [Cupriavidus basilensis]EHP40584.1 MltA-interacting MipA [Cupriavidus basilensis OR16]
MSVLRIDKDMFAWCVSGLLIGIAGNALGQAERGPERLPAVGTETGGSIGPGVRVAPDYLGAKDTRVLPVPVVYIQHGALFLDSARGAGYRYETASGLYWAQALNWDLGRVDRKSSVRPGADRLRGMGTVKGSLVTTAELGYNVAPWLAIRAEAEFALSERDRGNRYRVGLEGALWARAQDDVWYTVDAHFSDRRFARTYFGVTPTQSAASGFANYAPDRGLYAYSYSLNWEHRFSRHWSALLSINAVNLTGAAGRSPIVQESFNVYALGAINYTF